MSGDPASGDPATDAVPATGLQVTRAAATEISAVLEALVAMATADRTGASGAQATVRVGAAAIDPTDEARLHPVEAEIIATAVGKRRREFASGRALLRFLLDTDQPVTVLASRAPLLPAGVVASLAHDDDIVIAATSRDPSVRSLGVDIEPTGAVDGEVADVVRRLEERHLDPTFVFVAKEAVYKAWSSSGGRFLNHHDVQVTDTGGGGFTAVVIDQQRSFIGRSASVGGRIIAIVVDLRDDVAR